MLTTRSLLNIKSSARKVRLSCVLVDEGGCRKGLTTASLLTARSPISDISIAGDERLAVYSSKERVGTSDPARYEGWQFVSDAVAGTGDGLVSSGTLTCAFTIPDIVNVAPALGPAYVNRVAEWHKAVERPGIVLGEGPIGVFHKELGHLIRGESVLYPILHLERSPQDQSTEIGIRNGAMVVAEDGGLVGIIVAQVEAGSGYAVVPMHEVLGWHHFQFAETLEISTLAEQPRIARAPRWRPPRRADERLKILVA